MSEASSVDHVPVLIAGGGPVGLTLALTLARHGVPALLVERNPSTTTHPKMDITNGRSMELYRQLGIAQELRKVAVPEDHPFDVAWATDATAMLDRARGAVGASIPTPRKAYSR